MLLHYAAARGGSVVGAGGGAPAYTPIKTISFDAGTNGNQAWPSAFEAIQGNATTGNAYPYFSNDIAGPFGGGITAKMKWGGTLARYWGGRICAPDFRPTEGSELWIRFYHYFPQSVANGGSDTENFYFRNQGDTDSWGSQKWIRLQWGPDTGSNPRQTFQLDTFGNSSASTQATGRMWGCTNEGFSTGQNITFPSPQTISRGGWKSLEYYVKFSDNPALGEIRGWLDDVPCGAVTTQTMSSNGAHNLTEVILGDYWNGGGVPDDCLYIDEIIVTVEEPDAVDSTSFPIIGMDRMVSDF